MESGLADCACCAPERLMEFFSVQPGLLASGRLQVSVCALVMKGANHEWHIRLPRRAVFYLPITIRSLPGRATASIRKMFLVPSQDSYLPSRRNYSHSASNPHKESVLSSSHNHSAFCGGIGLKRDKAPCNFFWLSRNSKINKTHLPLGEKRGYLC